MLTAFILSFLISSPYLVLTNAHNSNVLKVAPMENSVFSVSYIHSVNQSLVEEIYTVTGRTIVLTTLEFETFGAGMPTELEYGQELIRLDNGRMRIENFNRTINDLIYMVGYTAHHALNINGNTTPLTKLAESGQPIRFTVRRLNIWQLLIKGEVF